MPAESQSEQPAGSLSNRTDGNNGRRPVHLAYLDGLRAVAALYVVLHHCWLNVPQISSRILFDLLDWGHFSVVVFIVLSGFCLMLPIVRGDGTLRGGAWKFYLRRARRILPPYYFAIVFALVLIYFFIGRPTGTHWDVSLPVTRMAILAHVLLIHNFTRYNSTINHAMWSIAVEWQIYFFFPLLVVSWRRCGSIATTLVMTAISLAIYLGVRDTVRIGSAAWFIGLFVFGMLGASIAYGQEELYRRLRTLPWTAISAALLIVVGFWIDRIASHWFDDVGYLDLLGGLGTTALLVAVANKPYGTIGRILSWRPLVFVGTFSYSLYLIHAPLLQLIWQYALRPFGIDPMAQFAILALCGLGPVVGVSYVFFLLFERPWLVKRRRETMADVAVDAALSPGP